MAVTGEQAAAIMRAIARLDSEIQHVILERTKGPSEDYRIKLDNIYTTSYWDRLHLYSLLGVNDPPAI